MKPHPPKILIDFIEGQDKKLREGENYNVILFYHYVNFTVSWKDFPNEPSLVVNSIVPMDSEVKFTLKEDSCINILCDSPVYKAWFDRIKDLNELILKTEEQYDYTFDC